MYAAQFLSGRVALVTGGAGGIGAAVSEARAEPPRDQTRPRGVFEKKQGCGAFSLLAALSAEKPPPDERYLARASASTVSARESTDRPPDRE